MIWNIESAAIFVIRLNLRIRMKEDAGNTCK